jgi:pyruvate dehydrogenase E2 component (dihydrolipoamide acetyltransferase)
MATPVIMPRQGQSVESCILVEWMKAVGDAVAKGDPLASIETDKAVFEVESPADGTLLERFFEAGADIPVLMNIAAIGTPGEDVAELRPAEAGSAPAAAAASAKAAPATLVEESAVQSVPATLVTAAPAAGSAAAGVSPRARQSASAKGVDPAALAGSGPGGRVIERDVLAAAAALPRMSATANAAARASGLAAPAQGSGPGGMVLAADLVARPATAATGAMAAEPLTAPVTIPLKGIRKLIAQRMRDSLGGTAQITLNMSFDASQLLAYRAKVKEQADALGLPNITVNDLIAFVTIRTLRQHPDLNAHFLGDRTVQYPNVNLGIATDTDRGLMVPVVHGAEKLSLSALSSAIKPLIKACQTGSINPDLLSGGTFTITNMGMLGIESFTPVLNVPEVAILGVGALFLKPVLKGTEVNHVQAINLSLTVDHQTVDGAPAARFLKALCTGLEHVELSLAG